MRRLPAEWEPQSGILLTWPHEATDWAERLDEVEPLYAELAALISRFEPVLIVCHNAEQAETVRARALDAGTAPERLRLALAPSNDTWARDHGPIGVLDGGDHPLLIDFRFNGWGGKYPAGLDDHISRTLADQATFGRCELERSTLVLEGGAIESDGQGSLLMVRRTLIDPHRNPEWSPAEIEQELAMRLGARHLLWLEHGAISGDDTDGHIDTLARFCAPDCICYSRCEDPADADFAELNAMEAELRALRDPQGRPYRLVALPTPSPQHDEQGQRLPAGYANFLILNGAVIVPTYADPADERALAILAECFPGRDILGLDCRPLIHQGGSLHCISMQLTQGVLPEMAD